MNHTYLRYECADSFGLTVSSGSSKAPPSQNVLSFLGETTLLTIAGSQIVGTNLKTDGRNLQIGHRESANVGTGRALNADEVVCLAVSNHNHTENTETKVATGWIDGTVRIFDLTKDEVEHPHHGLAHSLLMDDNDDFVQRPPLVLRGHESAVRSLQFDKSMKLASGGSDGAIVLWDVVAETGLFRLVGHRGGITHLQFVEFQTTSTTSSLLVSSSLDGLVKIWDLEAQCCTQTIAAHRGEVWAAACLQRQVGSDDIRWRLVSGGTEGRAQVWSMEPSKRSLQKNKEDAESLDDKAAENQDDVCFYMGHLIPPPNVATSAEKIVSITYDPSGRFVGILQANSKSLDLYALRSSKEAGRKRLRRLKRRQEKLNKKRNEPSESTLGQKRGLIDDDDEDPASSEDDDDQKNALQQQQQLDPELLLASDEFEYLTTARATHKIRGFTFCPVKEKGEVVRIVCALATNALEIMALHREKDE